MTINDIKNGSTRTEAMNAQANTFDTCTSVAHSELEAFARIIAIAQEAKAAKEDKSYVEFKKEVATEVLGVSAEILHYASTEEVKTIVNALFELIG